MIFRVEHFVGTGEACLLDSSDMSLSYGNNALEHILVHIRVRLMEKSFVSLACGTRLIGVDSRNDKYLVNYLLLHLSQPQYIVDNRVLVICRARSDYKKKSKKTLSEELLDYLKENINYLYNDCLNEIGYKLIIEDDKHVPEDKRKRFAFVGCGCGITWLKYRKSNKRAEKIEIAACKFRENEVLEMLLKKLPKKIYNNLKNIGCPFEAVWYQMQNLQIEYYSLVVQFAETKGIKMRIESHLD